MPIGEARPGQEECAHCKEYKARHHRHAIAGDRQHVREAGNVHGLVDLARNGIALAGNQRGGNGAAVARQDSTNALVDRFPDAVDEYRIPQPQRVRMRRLGRAQLSQHEPGSAKPLKIYAVSRNYKDL
jgi:hypothetical protein